MPRALSGLDAAWLQGRAPQARGAAQGIIQRVPMIAAHAYALRRLSDAYRGPLINVRRSSDNATQDIYARGDGWLDTAALMAFVGAGSGSIATWYDQAGGNNLVQAGTGSQPVIVNAGALATINGRPAFDTSTSQSMMQAANCSLLL